MVAPIGNTANKSSFSPTNFSTSITAPNVINSLPAMSFVNDIGMDIPTERVPVSDSEVRGRNTVSTVNLSRESLMASSGRSTPYHDRMDTDMDCNPTIEELSPERLELSYKTEQENALQVSMAANHQETTGPLNVHNEAPPTHTPTRMMSLTSSFHTTLRPLPNQNYRVVLSTPFPFMDPSSTLLQTPGTSKLPSISWPNTFKTNKLMVVRLTTSMISTVWEMPSGTSSRQSMRLDRMHCTLTKKLTHLGQKYLQSLP